MTARGASALPDRGLRGSVRRSTQIRRRWSAPGCALPTSSSRWAGGCGSRNSAAPRTCRRPRATGYKGSPRPPCSIRAPAAVTRSRSTPSRARRFPRGISSATSPSPVRAPPPRLARDGPCARAGLSACIPARCRGAGPARRLGGGRAARAAPRARRAGRVRATPPPPSLPCKVDTSRPSLRTNWTCLVPFRVQRPGAGRARFCSGSGGGRRAAGAARAPRGHVGLVPPQPRAARLARHLGGGRRHHHQAHARRALCRLALCDRSGPRASPRRRRVAWRRVPPPPSY